MVRVEAVSTHTHRNQGKEAVRDYNGTPTRNKYLRHGTSTITAPSQRPTQETAQERHRGNHTRRFFAWDSRLAGWGNQDLRGPSSAVVLAEAFVMTWCYGGEALSPSWLIEVVSRTPCRSGEGTLGRTWELGDPLMRYESTVDFSPKSRPPKDGMRSARTKGWDGHRDVVTGY